MGIAAQLKGMRGFQTKYKYKHTHSEAPWHTGKSTEEQILGNLNFTHFSTFSSLIYKYLLD